MVLLLGLVILSRYFTLTTSKVLHTPGKGRDVPLFPCVPLCPPPPGSARLLVVPHAECRPIPCYNRFINHPGWYSLVPSLPLPPWLRMTSNLKQDNMSSFKFCLALQGNIRSAAAQSLWSCCALLYFSSPKLYNLPLPLLFLLFISQWYGLSCGTTLTLRLPLTSTRMLNTSLENDKLHVLHINQPDLTPVQQSLL